MAVVINWLAMMNMRDGDDIDNRLRAGYHFRR